MTRKRQMVRGWSIPDPNTCLLLMKWGGDTHPRAMHRAPSATVACCLDIPSHPAPLCPQPHGVATFLGSPPAVPRRMGRGSPLWVKTLLCSLFSKRSPRGYKNSQQALVSLRSLTFFHWEFVYRQP